MAAKITSTTPAMSTMPSMTGLPVAVRNEVGSASKSGPDYASRLSGPNRDAYLALTALFKTYNLESLAPKIYDYIKNGYSSDTITILLQDTPEYKQRFIGNQARMKAGLPVLSPQDYLKTEEAYKQVMMSAGLPAGFYDQPQDFAGWIGKDVSPTEIQSRVDMATQATVLAAPAYKQALNQMGITDAQLTAYWLDPNKSLPILQKSAATAAIGAQALQHGLTFDTSYAGRLATEGITAQQAQQGYGQISQTLPELSQMGQRYGYQYGQRQAEQATFENDADILAQQKRIIGQEAGEFAGSVGGAQRGLAQPASQH
jgi:hypothetical protein